MATIANLLVRLGADFGDAPQKVRDLNEGMSDLGHSAEEAGGRIDELGKHAHESGEGFGDLSEKLLDFGKEAGVMALEGAGLVSVLESLKKSLEITAEIDSATVALTQFTGSTEDAIDVIENLERISNSEALEFKGVLAAAQHFMALGFSTEQTERTMQVAGNAARALGTSVESVSQRMGMMVNGGMLSGRFLKSLGLQIQDLATVMGITGKSAEDMEDKVRRAFKFESEEDRLRTLQDAMDKFAGLGGKEADTLGGKWIEFKNNLEEAFVSVGDMFSPAATVILDAVSEITNALTGLINQLNIVKDVKMSVDVRPLVHIDDNGATQKTLTRKNLSNPGEGPLAVPGTGGVLAPDVHARSTAPGGLQKDLDEAAAKNALAESDAAQEYARNKTRIDSQAASAKALVELWRSAYATLAATHQVAYAEQLAQDRNFNDDELRITLNAINQKKALQTSTKGLKEEDKDATLDAQAQSAREKNAAANAALESKELDRQSKFNEAVVKTGEQRVIKEHELQDKMQSQLEAFVLEQDGEWRKIIEGEQKAAFSDAEAKNKSEAAGRQTTNARLGQSIKSSQMSLERSYGLEYTHTLAQQVAYQRQLGELAAQQLDIKVREASVVADASKKLADMAAANAAGVVDEELKRKAVEASTKAQDDALKSQEAQNAAADARYETETKIADLIKQQAITGQLAAQFASAGQALPGNIGGGIASGIFHQGKGGMDIGKQITDALRNVGKNLLGDTLTAAIRELVIKTGLQTAAQSLLTAIFGAQAPTQTAATTANTAAVTTLATAVVANTAAVTASATTSGAGAAVGAGGAAAGAVTNVATSAATGGLASVIGPVIGGVISGVISAVATSIGDASIVGAINKTTAAVYSLRTSGVASSSPTGAPGAAGGQPAQTPPASSSFFENIASSLLNAFTASDAIPVKIMAINPGIVFASVASMFGFASGGPVLYDMVAKVHAGEHVLNAAQVAGLAPLPDLPAFSQYGGVSRDQGTAISSQSSNASNVSMSGPMHFHGVQNVRQLMKEISEVAKNASPSHSPLGR